MITILKKTREKIHFEQDTKTRDEGAGHTTESYYYYLNTFSFPFRIKFVNSKALYNKFNVLPCTKQENRKGFW